MKFCADAPTFKELNTEITNVPRVCVDALEYEMRFKKDTNGILNVPSNGFPAGIMKCGSNVCEVSEVATNAFTSPGSERGTKYAISLPC
jgi:hypothetical protein